MPRGKVGTSSTSGKGGSLDTNKKRPSAALDTHDAPVVRVAPAVRVPPPAFIARAERQAREAAARAATLRVAPTVRISPATLVKQAEQQKREAAARAAACVATFAATGPPATLAQPTTTLVARVSPGLRTASIQPNSTLDSTLAALDLPGPRAALVQPDSTLVAPDLPPSRAAPVQPDSTLGASDPPRPRTAPVQADSTLVAPNPPSPRIARVQEDGPEGQQRTTRGLTLGVKAPKAGQLKVLVTVLRNTILPAKATSKIGPLFRRNFTELRTKWNMWKDDLDLVLGEYLRYFRFVSPEEEARGRIVWEYIAAKNYPNYLHGWKRNAIKAYGSVAAARNHKQRWTSLEVWQKLCDYWMSERFLQSSALHKTNRSSMKSIPHTSGRVTYEERELLLADSLGRAPTQIEIFTQTHLTTDKKSDNNEKIWVSEDAKSLEADYANKLREVNGLDPEVPVNAVLYPGCDPVPDLGCKTWEVAAGGATKGRLFGRPGEKWTKRSGCASSVDYARYVASQNNLEEMKKLKQDLHEKTKQIAEQGAYFASIAPFLVAMAEKCGLQPPPPPPMFHPPIHANSSTPSSDGASNIPASPFGDEEDDDEMT